jgi:hypothetical protein
MSKKSVLDSLRVSKPCTEDWDRMTGNAKVRFCSHCAKDVNNISEMTPKEAIRLARRSNGNICIRYKYDPVTKVPLFSARLHQITRSPMAATGLIAATIAFSATGFAQGGTGVPGIRTEIVQADNKIDGSASTPTEPEVLGCVKGKVRDVNGAVIPNMVIGLLNLETQDTKYTSSDAEGVYMFKDLPKGSYSIRIEAQFGFAAKYSETVEVSSGRDSEQDVMMNVGTPETEVTVGGVMASVIEYEGSLAAAVAQEDLEQVQELISHGENVNVKEKDRTTPLHIAVETGNIQIVESLLNFGAKVNSRNDDRRTPLMNLDEDATPELVDLLIRHGAKVRLVDNEGNTALIHAVENSVNAEIIKRLVDAGSDVNVVNKKGRTALMNAAYEDDVESVRALLLGGAKVDLKDKEGETAYQLTSDEEIEALLVSYGATPEVEGEVDLEPHVD